MAIGDNPRAEGAYHVIGGHVIAAVTGLIAHLLFADGLLVIDVFERADRFSSEIGLLALSGIVSMILTTVGMLWSNTNHPAACATTLIVALGLMSTVRDGFIIGAVVLLVDFQNAVLEPLRESLGIEPKNPR